MTPIKSQKQKKIKQAALKETKGKLFLKSDYYLIFFSVFLALALAGSLAFFPEEGLLISLISGLVLLIALFLKNPLWAVYLMFFLFPFLYLSFNYHGLNIPIADIWGTVGFIAWSLGTAGIMILTKQKPALELPGWPFFALFFLVSALSLLNSFNILLSLKFLIRPLIFMYAVYLVFPYNSVNSREELGKIFKIVTISGILAAIISLFYLSREIGGVIPRINPRSFFGIAPLGYNHNLIAGTMLATIPAAYAALKFTKNSLAKKLIIISLFLQTFILLFTFSRSGWLALFGEIWLIGILDYRKQMRKFIKFLVVGLILAIPFIFFMVKLSTSQVADESNYKRLVLIEKSWELFLGHPVLGNGIGTFTEELIRDRLYLIDFGTEGTNAAHGIVWKLLAENGLLGLIAFCLIIFWLLAELIKARKHCAAKDRELVSIMIALVAGITFFQLFQTTYYTQKVWLPFCLALLVIKFVYYKNQHEAS